MDYPKPKGGKRKARKIAKANRKAGAHLQKRIDNPLTVGRLHGKPKMIDKGDGTKQGYANVAAKYPKYHGYVPKPDLKKNVPRRP